MLTGERRSQVNAIWDAFWSGGISNPLEVMEQITYLLFLKRLDDLHQLEANRSRRLGKPMERPIFPAGNDAKGRPFEDLRWSVFKHRAPAEMYVIVSEHVFPFLRTLGGDDSTYAHRMKDARFTIPTPALLSKVVGPGGGRRHLRSGVRHAARRAFWSRRASICARGIPRSCTTRRRSSTSTAGSFTASTSTTRCCGSAA